VSAALLWLHGCEEMMQEAIFCRLACHVARKNCVSIDRAQLIKLNWLSFLHPHEMEE
jgi:hypothetical protein